MLNRKLITQSEIRNMSLECEKINGINLSQGISNLKLNEQIEEGTREAISNGFNYYTRYDGIDELKEEIFIKANNYNKIKCDPNKNVIVSSGATGAFYSACIALLNPGDEVILFEPYYGYHVNTLISLGIKPIFVKLDLPDLTINFEELIKKITIKTRAIIICTPSNPSGKVYTIDELIKLGEISKLNSLKVFTDEIYEYFLYDNMEHISPASLNIFKDNTITISGYSKTFSITGWRVGYLIAPEEFHDLIGHINDLIYVCAPSPLQYGVARGINKIKDKFYQSIISSFTKKRDLICNTLNQIGLMPIQPQGAYYVLADVSKINGKNSKEKAMNILKKTKVACVPGSSFYSDPGDDNLVRFCFAKEDFELEKACEYLLKLKK